MASRRIERGSFGPAAVDAWLVARLPPYPDVDLCLALSGGVDSAALLAALASARDARPARARPRVRAVHVDHHLHPESVQWSRHCRALARQARVPLVVLDARVPRAAGRSLEADAREARYALLRAALREGEILVTAHHADDQLETVLLQLLRGAGVRGLAAMPEIAPFGPGLMARPLLAFSRAAIAAWARDARIEWVEDPTNSDDRFDRSFLRQRVVPILRERWPGAAEAVSRAARHAADAQRMLDAVARADVERAADGAALSASALRALDIERRCNALRYWIGRGGMALPDARRLREISGPLLAARADANPVVSWGDAAIRRHGDRISLERREAAATRPVQVWQWKVDQALALPDDLGTLTLARDPRGPIDLGRVPDSVTVRWRAGGEYLRPKQGGPRRSLKSLLHTAKLAPLERERLPLIVDGERVLAAGDRWVDASIQALDDATDRSRLVWHRVSN
ncbi:MAG: tRNA lysidine(34) synthetase TilS [Steroidobacteraceae bacterium]